MTQVELQDHEVSVLQEILDVELEDLHKEIHHTDDRQYRVELKDKQATLERIREALTHTAA